MKCLLTLAALAASACALIAAPPSEYLAFAGAYGKAIYAFRFHARTGRFTRIGVAAEAVNPSFLAVHPSGRFLYAVNENGAKDDTVSAFAIDAQSGKLAPLNQVSSHGSAPCHLAFDHTGKWLAVANYASGSIAVMPVLADGRLGEATASDQHQGGSKDAARQKGPHAHAVLFSPDNRFLLSADLGADKIFVYRFDAAAGTIAPADPPFTSVMPGAGVRHLLFHPSGLALYALNEMASSIAVFRYDPATGSLNDAQSLPTLPLANAIGTAAELVINPAGTTLYSTNRGADSITLFSIDPDRYLLTPREATPSLGKTPRFITFDPTGAFLIAANQDPGSLAVFRAHPRTGDLRPATPSVSGIPQASCLVFAPLAGR